MTTPAPTHGLAPLRPDEWGDAEYDAYGSLLGIPGEKVPRAGSGHRYDPLNFAVVGTFMHHPELAKNFLRLQQLPTPAWLAARCGGGSWRSCGSPTAGSAPTSGAST